MHNYVTAETAEGEVILVEWNHVKGIINISTPGYSRKFDGLSGMKHGMVGQGEVHWSGANFSVLKTTHDFFSEEYPGLNLEEQYLMADTWCTKKQWQPKNNAAFLSNWMKKAAAYRNKGNAKAGGVVY